MGVLRHSARDEKDEEHSEGAEVDDPPTVEFGQRAKDHRAEAQATDVSGEADRRHLSADVEVLLQLFVG